MSEDKGQHEPSMEDILASIRRILSEDEAEEAAKPAAQPAPPPPAAPEEPEDDVLELTDDMVADDVEEEVPEPEPEPEPEIDLSAWGLDEQDVEEEEAPPPPPPPPPPQVARPAPKLVVDDAPEEEDDELESWVSAPVAEASTAALTELARAVARERMVGVGTRGITLEDMVRDIMKPILKEWLDKNLPYMIERIVRKEIERMVNRAEKV